MPPKKAAAKANTPAKKVAPPAEAPATITTAKGKEIEATAAAGRPRRATAADTPAPKPKSAPAKRAAPKSANTSAKVTAAPTTGKRGRPAKATEDATEAAEPPKKRGKATKSTEEVEPAKPAIKAKAAPATKTKAAPAGKKRGRPAKTSEIPAPAVPEEEEAPPKARGRPPKGGETTKVEAADEAAAEQLEEELVDAAVEEGADEPSKRQPAKKRGRPPGKGKGKKAVAKEELEKEADADDENDVEGTSGRKNYWLMKAEQEDREETLKDGSVFNSKFTIDDLRDKAEPEPWDGVRNPTACKNMREMKRGDLAFFYASGGKKGRVPGITGIMEIVKEHEADPGAFDENSPYYVENAKQRGTKEKPRWSMVHVEFRKKLSKPVSLKELQKYKQEGGALAKLQEFTTARLSVSKVSEAEWNFIVDKLIEGYEEDESNTAGPAPKVDSDVDMGYAELTNGTTVKQSIEAAHLPSGTVVVSEDSKEIPDTDVPATDTLATGATLATSSRPPSRAASRAGSRPPSRAASRTRAEMKSTTSRPGSRNGSLAPPPRAVSRGRSRTPAARAGSAKPGMKSVAEEMEAVEE